MNSAFYAGYVTHERFGARAHRFRYGMFQALFDLDEVDALARNRLFSRNRFNLFAFHDRDHGDGSGMPLRAQIEGHLRSAGLEPDGGAIRLLAMPRILGHVFNPISVWFCHRRDGSVLAMLYEVTNTFRERHTYLIPVREDGAVIRQSCEKQLYVSPFMDMAMGYRFAVRRPAGQVQVVVAGDDDHGPLIVATFAGKRRDFGDGQILRLFLRYPLLTLKVVAGIHFEALRLWLKGAGVRRHAEPPRHAVTVVASG